MIIDTDQITKLLLEDEHSIYSIAKEISVTRSTLNLYRQKQDEDYIKEMSLDLAMKLQKYINEESAKMNVNDIENIDYIWVFDDLSEYLNEDQNFISNDDFAWWQELADALAYMEEEQEIDTSDLEINELQDYIDIAKEHGFETSGR